MALSDCQHAQDLFVGLELPPGPGVLHPAGEVVEESDEDERVLRASGVDGGEVAKGLHHRPIQRSAGLAQGRDVHKEMSMVVGVLAEVC